MTNGLPNLNSETQRLVQNVNLKLKECNFEVALDEINMVLVESTMVKHP